MVVYTMARLSSHPQITFSSEVKDYHYTHLIQLVNHPAIHLLAQTKLLPRKEVYTFGKKETVEEWYDRQHFYRKPACYNPSKL
jgi:hypothetical protein